VNIAQRLHRRVPIADRVSPILGLVSAAAVLLSASASLAEERAGRAPLPDEQLDTALVLAVDTSRSVDEMRFRLQMDGIAAALEDPGVINTILGGPRGTIAIMLVSWADRSNIVLPWTAIGSNEDALTVAARIRQLPRYGGEYTCIARMLRNLKETVVDEIGFRPLKIVIDVSGDGIDNCEPGVSLNDAKEQMIEAGAVINGLPILSDKELLVGEGAYLFAPGAGLLPLAPPNQHERMTLDVWYQRNVIGGFGAFTIPANGYGDFARAMRSKFVVEISLGPVSAANRPGRTASTRQ
jgi:Protein of unknown function (DUF1194)